MDECMSGYMDGWFVLNAVYDTVHPDPLRELGMSYSNIRKQRGFPAHIYQFLKINGEILTVIIYLF